jgi:S-adenosylmethionine synthetase
MEDSDCLINRGLFNIKVMGVRNKANIKLTVAIAIVDKYVSSINDYIQKINEVKELLKGQEWSGRETDIEINTADDYGRESIYLTVSGTSAEGGDDGQVGRGNRANGLITPYRPMTLEAVAGKNPVSHVGKIYNLFSNELCRLIVDGGYAEHAYCYIVSQIGKPINEPLVLDIHVKGKDYDEEAIRQIAEKMLEEMPVMWEKVVKGRYLIA